MKSFMSFVHNFLFLLVAVFSGTTLFVIANGVATGNELTPFNVAIDNVVVHFRTPLLTNVMLFFTNVGSPFVLTVLAVFIAILLLLKRDTYDALLYLISVAVSIVAFLLMKNAFHISRPLDDLIALNSWSFPSGHATVASAFFFATGYTYFSRFEMVVSKILLILGCVAGVAVISASRVYLGAHFALDVLAGAALGLLCVSLTILFFNIFLEEEKWRHRKLFGKMVRLNK